MVNTGKGENVPQVGKKFQIPRSKIQINSNSHDPNNKGLDHWQSAVGIGLLLSVSLFEGIIIDFFGVINKNYQTCLKTTSFPTLSSASLPRISALLSGTCPAGKWKQTG